MGTAVLEDSRVVVVDGEVFDSTYIKLLKEFEENAVFTLAGTGAVEYTDDKMVVSEVNFTHAMFTPHPAVEVCSIEFCEG